MTRDRHDESGMTLIELLVSIAIIGLLTTVIAAAVTVVLRQSPETSARVDMARWEQNLGTWLPSDLTAAEWPEDQNRAYHCGTPACDFGENVLHLNWDDGGPVDVSYRYGEVDGDWQFRRVECSGGNCTSVTLVRNMPPPVVGPPPVPPISVTFPPDVVTTDSNGSEVVTAGGRSVTVSVTGPFGTDTLTFAGSGVSRLDLEPAAIQPPQFLQARSGCGGPITLMVDESGSIGSAVGDVRSAVRSFVSKFAGTPTTLQIVGFGSVVRVLDDDPGDPTPEPWNHWFDLSEQSTVDLLLGSSSPIDELTTSGYTNWEDAFYRALYTRQGQTYETVSNPATPPSELIVFFTDGLPTLDRSTDRTGDQLEPGAPSVPGRFNASYAGNSTRFSPRGWFRTWWLRQQTSTRMIGVGVGGINATVDLDRDSGLSDASIRDGWSAPYDDNSGPGDQDRSFSAVVALGDLIADRDLSSYDGTPGGYVQVEYDGGWDQEAVKNADVLITDDFAAFGPALEAIALGECGGTLTVQTRKPDGTVLTSPVTYEVSGATRPVTESTTSAVSKTAVFDIATEDGTEADVLLRPRSLDGSDFAADSWTCRSSNVAVPVVEADAGVGAAGGIELTVAANEAVSCILFVVPDP